MGTIQSCANRVCIQTLEKIIVALLSVYFAQPLVKFKSHLYYEDKDKVAEALKGLQTVPNSKIVFFKNGKSQGVAFENINGGAYYPALSIFKNATVSVNFGPNFKYPEIEDEYRCKGVGVVGVCARPI